MAIGSSTETVLVIRTYYRLRMGSEYSSLYKLRRKSARRILLPRKIQHTFRYRDLYITKTHGKRNLYVVHINFTKELHTTRREKWNVDSNANGRNFCPLWFALWLMLAPYTGAPVIDSQQNFSRDSTFLLIHKISLAIL